MELLLRGPDCAEEDLDVLPSRARGRVYFGEAFKAKFPLWLKNVVSLIALRGEEGWGCVETQPVGSVVVERAIDKARAFGLSEASILQGM